jgi:DNA-binding response OmpR family regulator
MLAATEDAAQRQAGLAAGADDCVVERFDGRELPDWVRTWLRAARSLQSFQQQLSFEREWQCAQPTCGCTASAGGAMVRV